MLELLVVGGMALAQTARTSGAENAFTRAPVATTGLSHGAGAPVQLLALVQATPPLRMVRAAGGAAAAGDTDHGSEGTSAGSLRAEVGGKSPRVSLVEDQPARGPSAANAFLEAMLQPTIDMVRAAAASAFFLEAMLEPVVRAAAASAFFLEPTWHEAVRRALSSAVESVQRQTDHLLGSAAWRAAAVCLPAPHVGLTDDGALKLEWIRGSRILTVFFEPVETDSGWTFASSAGQGAAAWGTLSDFEPRRILAKILD